MMFVLLALAACAHVNVPCEVTPDPTSPLVTHVAWDSGAPGTSTLSFQWDEEGGEGVVTDVTATAHSASIVGVPPLTEVAYSASTDDGKRAWRCEGTFRTPNLAVSTPKLLVTVDVPERQSPERYVVGSLYSATADPMFVFDRQGRYRWFLEDDEDHMVLMATPAVGGGVVNSRFGRPQGFVDGELVWRDLAGDAVTSIPLPGSHHVFRELPDGSILYLKLDIREAEVGGDTRTVIGDSVVERSPDGTERVLFTTWDHLELRDDVLTHPAFYPQGIDWVHGNALFYVEERDTILYSMAHVRTVVEFERSTGNVVRSFRGDANWMLEGPSYTVAEGEPFRHQHDAHFDEEGNLVVFATDSLGSNTGAHVYAIDESAQTLREIWRHVPEPALLNLVLGQVQELENGNRLVAFPYAGLLQEVTPDEDVVWEVRTPLGVMFMQTYLRDDLP